MYVEVYQGIKEIMLKYKIQRKIGENVHLKKHHHFQHSSHQRMKILMN